MKRKLIITSLLALYYVSSMAQLFWKVSGNGLAAPSYLFGTHHLIQKEQIPDFDKILEFINEVDMVVGELDLSDMAGMQFKLIKGAMMKDTTLSDLVSANELMLIDSAFKEVSGIGVKKFQKFKPMMLNTMYTVLLYMKQNNIKKEPEAIDLIVQKAGKRNKKKIIGLETVEQQIDILFNSISLKQQAELLVKTITDKNKSFEISNKLNEYYLKGDLKNLQLLSSEEPEMTPELSKAMIDNRNNNWIEQLKVHFQTNSCFVAVGCLHLTGQTGLLNQLADLGFTIEPVSF